MIVELVLIAVLLLAVAVFVTAPLRRPSREASDAEDPRLAELEARKEARYREIRDAEMDREAGKITREQWKRQDAELRREAIEILKQIDTLRGAKRR